MKNALKYKQEISYYYHGYLEHGEIYVLKYSCEMGGACYGGWAPMSISATPHHDFISLLSAAH